MNIKIDPKIKKAGGVLLGMAFTGIGTMITNRIQQNDQKETMVKIAKEVFKEELQNK